MSEELKHFKKYIDERANKGNEELFFNLNLSVISGEYLRNYAEFKNIASALNPNVADLVQSLEDIVQPVDNIEEDNEITEKDSFFDNAISHYIELTDNINENIKEILKKDDEKKELKPKRIKVKYEIERLFYERHDFKNTNLKPGYFLFLINLNLAELDEYLECSEWCLNEIDLLENYLEENSNIIVDKWYSQIIDILKDKCKYLKYKINYRATKKSDILITENSAFYEFYKETNEHYAKENIVNGVSEIINNCWDENSSKIAIENGKPKRFGIFYKKTINTDEYRRLLNTANLNSKKIHQLNKFLKNTTKLNLEEKLSNISTLVTNIEGQLTNTTNEFQQIYLHSSLNLLQNTQLFLILKQEELIGYKNICGDNFYTGSAFQKSNSFRKKIEGELNRLYKDYRGYEHVIDFLDKLFDKLQNPEYFFDFLKKDEHHIDDSKLPLYKENILKNINNIKKFYEEILHKIEENKKYLTHYEVKPIYLEVENCLKSYLIKVPEGEELKNEKIDIFLDSSYILPINYEKISNKINQKSLVYNYEIKLIEGRLDILFDLDLARKKYHNIENKFKENEFKVVQIVAMFVSIATFVLINVKIFDNKSGSESFAIILGLAGVFTLFNGFFNWLIQGQLYKKVDSRFYLFFLLPTFLILAGGCIMYCSDNKTIIENVDKSLDEKIDSLVMVKTLKIERKYKIDSINNLVDKIQLENRLKQIEKQNPN